MVSIQTAWELETNQGFVGKSKTKETRPPWGWQLRLWGKKNHRFIDPDLNNAPFERNFLGTNFSVGIFWCHWCHWCHYDSLEKRFINMNGRRFFFGFLGAARDGGLGRWNLLFLWDWLVAAVGKFVRTKATWGNMFFFSGNIYIYIYSWAELCLVTSTIAMDDHFP